MLRKAGRISPRVRPLREITEHCDSGSIDSDEHIAPHEQQRIGKPGMGERQWQEGSSNGRNQ